MHEKKFIKDLALETMKYLIQNYSNDAVIEALGSLSCQDKNLVIREISMGYLTEIIQILGANISQISPRS